MKTTLTTLAIGLSLALGVSAGFEDWRSSDGRQARMKLIEVVRDGDTLKGKFEIQGGRTVTLAANALAEEEINPLFPALRSGHRLFQRPSHKKQIPSSHPNGSGRNLHSAMRFLSIFLLIAFLLQAGAEAAEFELYHEVIVAPTEVIIPVHMTNNDNGAVYDSAQVRAYASLAQAVFALGSHGSGSVAEMMAGWNYNISGEVSNGWSGTGGNDGTVSLTNNGVRLFGSPAYDLWQSTSTNSQQDEMQLNLGVPTTHLELNATPGYQPFTLADLSSASWDASLHDAIIVRSDSPLLRAPNHTGAATPGEIPEAFVGFTTGGFTIAASGLHYLLLTPGDFAEWTDFSTEHPALDPAEDANGNGRSNFLDNKVLPVKVIPTGSTRRRHGKHLKSIWTTAASWFSNTPDPPGA